MSNTYILKYTLEELNETETAIESILEDVLSTVDNVNILFEYSPEQIRLLHKKYGDSAFLDPKTKKYPIVDMLQKPFNEVNVKNIVNKLIMIRNMNMGNNQ